MQVTHHKTNWMKFLNIFFVSNEGDYQKSVQKYKEFNKGTIQNGYILRVLKISNHHILKEYY